MGGIDLEHQASSSEKKTSEIPETTESSRVKRSRIEGDNDDDDGDDDGVDDKETDESKGVVLKRTTSSLDSYHDCEEQCVYCLKMFALSVLVEHASVCSSLQLVKYLYAILE